MPATPPPINDPYNMNFGIGGSTNFGGGAIYSMQWTISEDPVPTKATIYAIGTNAPAPNLCALTTVHAGEFELGMYLLKSETRNKGGGQKITVGEFVDGSIVLDRFYVGLVGSYETLHKNKTYTGQIQYLSSRQLGFVKINCTGIMYDDGKANTDHGHLLILGAETIDPLDACGNRRVEYSFQDLLNKITPIVPIDIAGLIVNKNYRQSYVGTLRQVLGNWLSDYGFTFYWDGTKVQFLDLRQGISINLPSFDFPETCSQGSTMENTYGQAVVVSFRKPQENKSVQAVNYRPLYFRCLQLDNFLEESVAQDLYIESILAYHSPQLRDWWLISKALNDSSPNYGKLGWSNVTSYAEGSQQFTDAANAITTAISAGTNAGLENLSAVFNATAGVTTRRIFVVTENESARNASYTTALAVATDFIGRYYITNQSLTPTVVAQYYSQSASVKTGSGGRPSFIQANATLDQMPFGNLLLGLGAFGEANPSAGSYLLERQGAWNPPQRSSTVSQMGTTLANFLPMQFPAALLQPGSSLYNLVKANALNKVYFIASTDSVNISNNIELVNNFAEQDTVANNLAAQAQTNNANTFATPCEKCIQDNENRISDASKIGVGLRGVGNAPSITVNVGGTTYQLIGPSQFDYQALEVINTTKRFVIPEINKVYVTGDAVDCVYGFEVVQKDATVNYIIDIAAGALPMGGLVPLADIKPVYRDEKFTSIDVYLQQLALAIYAPQTAPQFYAEFRELGYPSRAYSPKDGLAGISVDIAENGVYTTYKFSSRPYKKPSADFVFASVDVSSNTSYLKRL